MGMPPQLELPLAFDKELVHVHGDVIGSMYTLPDPIPSHG
jgi:hypothetical protein